MRNRRRPLDRRIAVAVLVLAAVTMATTLVTSDAPAPARSGDARDALLTLARRHDRGRWLVRFTFERRFADGRHLAQETVEANRPPVHATASPDGVQIDFGTRVASCTGTPDGARCIEEHEGRSVPLAEVYRVVLDSGGYVAQFAPDRTIAGEDARCFRLVARRGLLPDLGTETELCYASDGVPLRTELHRSGVTDTRTARLVERNIDGRAIRDLLDRLDRTARENAG